MPVILAIGIVVLSLAVRDIDIARRARSLTETAAGVGGSTDYRRSQSYVILRNPLDLRSSKGRVSGLLEGNSILTVVVIVAILGTMTIIVMSSVGSPLMVTALIGLMIGLAFVSGPYRINILELYARKLLSVPQTELSAHDTCAARIITHKLLIWNLSKAGFALSLFVTPLLSVDLLLGYLALILFAAVIGFGSAYHVSRGIYAEPAKDSQKSDEQWVNRLLREIYLTQ